jgi:DNA-binding transcriptional ArsR family regulator
MAPERSTYDLVDDHGLQVLAHPLRLRLLGLLRSEGMATASRLAERVGESSGVTSYHLRKLAEVGLVAEDEQRGTRRERWWRSVHEGTRYSVADFLGNPEAHRATVSMRREIYRWQARLLEQWLAEEEDWDKAWVDVAGSSDDLLRLTPEQTKAMTDEIWAVVQRYRDAGAEGDASDAERVVWLQHVVPVRGELPL